MNQHPRELRARRKQRQQGAALLIVLFVLMMATTTAVYTLSSTQFEVRAAGSLHQAMRAKFVAEAATTGVIGLCYQLSTVGCIDLKRANGNLDTDTRRNYALPSWGSENVYSLSKTDLVGPSYDVGVMLPDDKGVSGVGSGGVAAAWSPTFLSVLEKWELGEPGQVSQKYRVIVSTYGALDMPGDIKVDATELRGAHSTISATRAYIDIRN